MKRALVLTLLALLGLCLCSACRRGGGSADVVETKEFAVSGAPRVTLVDFNGNIEVVAGAAGAVRAEIWKHSGNPDAGAAQRDLDRIKLNTTQAGADVSVAVAYTQPKTGRVEGERAAADIMLTVPPGTSLNLVTGRGDVKVPVGMGNTGLIVADGDVSIRLPVGAAFTLGGVMGSGSINSDFDGVKEGQHSGPLAATVGKQPATAITVTLGTGTLSLLRDR